MNYFKFIFFLVLVSISIVSLNAADPNVSATEQSNNLKLYPNPVTYGDALTISADKDIERVEVMNIVGQVMKIENFVMVPEVKLNIDELKEGIYFIKILFVDNTSSTKRLWVK
jgi:hypothetical protein